MNISDVVVFCQTYFLPITGLLYIIMKIIIKYLLRNIASLTYDFWEVISWFAVDLSFLNIGLSLSLKVHRLLQHDYQANEQGVMMWYIILGSILLLCIFLYGQINKRRNEALLAGITGTFTLSNFICCTFLTLLWGLGFAPMFIINFIVFK